MKEDDFGVGWTKEKGMALWTTNIGEETILHPKHAVRFETESTSSFNLNYNSTMKNINLYLNDYNGKLK